MGLVRGCDGDPTRRAIIASLVTLAHRTGSQVVAEGVETQGELEAVRWLGVDFVQGFLIAAPTETPTTLRHPWMVSASHRATLRGAHAHSGTPRRDLPEYGGRPRSVRG